MLVRREWLTVGLVAGLVGAATLAAFAAAAQWYTGDPITGTYAFLAKVLAGPQAEGAPWAVPTGIVVLVVGSILWAYGYLSAAEQQSQLFTRPIISGVFFGITVWLVMQLMLVPFGMFHPPGLYEFDRELIGFILFFGLPIALVSARLTRAR
jgi:hypothetical protein